MKRLVGSLALFLLIAVAAVDAQPGCQAKKAVLGADGHIYCTVNSGNTCTYCPQ